MSLTKITNKSLAPLTVLNANIAENTINGSKLAASTVTRDKLASDALDSNPIGTVIYYAGNTAPTGYLIANGSILDRTVYADLFAAIGTLHNRGSESATQFRIPDLRGEFIRGWDGGRNVDPNRVFGSFEDYATARPKKFDQTIRLAQADAATNVFDNSANAPHLAGFARVTRTGENLTATTVDAIGSGWQLDILNVLDGDEETRPRNVALLPCIKFSNGAMLSQNAINVQSLASTKMNITGGTFTGIVTNPTIPAFHARAYTVPASVTGTEIKGWGEVDLNIGNNFNPTTGRFTAPVNGLYYFYFYTLNANANIADTRIFFRINGFLTARGFIIDKSSASWNTISGMGVFNLSKNDFISIFLESSNELYSDGSHEGFGGYLIG